MKVLIVVALLAVGAYAKVIAPYEPIITGDEYHEKIGIPAYERALIEEEQMLSDPSRIVGGSASAAGQFPYQGFMAISVPGGTSACGCSLLSPTRSLSAAHCSFNVNGINKRYGTIWRTTGGLTRPATTIWNHPSYNQLTLSNDICVIAHAAVSYTNVIQPIALASGSNNYANTWATVSGAGATQSGGGVSTHKRHVNVQVITNQVCQQTFGSIIVASTICTSGAGGVGPCGGDSGGPLVIGSGNNRIQVGAVSFGAAAGCAAGFPSAYARMTSFGPWIRQHM